MKNASDADIAIDFIALPKGRKCAKAVLSKPRETS